MMTCDKFACLSVYEVPGITYSLLLHVCLSVVNLRRSTYIIIMDHLGSTDHV